MSKFRAGLVTMVVIEFGFIGGFSFFLLFKCWKFCPSSKGKKEGEQNSPDNNL